ncbi:MAG: hypothetical protein M3R61_16840 [Chloroflexota bacterium]|nr:hypothetical protein [Chloroflexota bacterium]
MKLHDGQGQAINHALPILRDIQHPQHYLADVIDGTHQIAPPPIEAGSLRNDRKQMLLILPLGNHVGFLIPFPTLADNRHGQQCTIGAGAWRTRAAIQRPNHLPDIVDEHKHPGAEVVKIGYHRRSPGAKGGSADRRSLAPGDGYVKVCN